MTSFSLTLGTVWSQASRQALCKLRDRKHPAACQVRRCPTAGAPGDTGPLGRPEDHLPHRPDEFLETSPKTLQVSIFL